MASCCRSAKTNYTGAVGFCQSLRTSTLVFLKDGGSTTLEVSLPNGQRTALSDAMRAYGCGARSTSGTWLASLVMRAWKLVIAKPGGADDVRVKLAGRAAQGVTMLDLRGVLYSIAPKCQSCGGNGCAACDKTGLAEE